MKLFISGFLSILVLGVLIVLGTSQTDAGWFYAPGPLPAPGQRPTCREKLDVCIADLNTCTDDLAACEAGAAGQTFPGDGYGNPDAYGVSGHGPALSYTDNGDGTFTDNNTGKMWEIKDNAGGIHHVGNTYTLNGTLFTVFLDVLNNKCDGDETTPCTSNADCTGIGNGLCGHAGHRDWRIPNIKELESIVDYSAFGPASSIPGWISLGGYWSATTFPHWTVAAWGVDFNDGTNFAYTKSDGWYARAVRP